MSYAESNDFQLNRNAALEMASEIGHEIGSESFCRHALANLEINDYHTRLMAIRCLLCVLQGGNHVEPRDQKIELHLNVPSIEVGCTFLSQFYRY